MRNYTIYALKDPITGLLDYVGATRDLKRRLREHKKVLGYRPDHIVLETGIGDWRQVEHRWIEKLRAEGASLRNKTVGGDGCQSHGPDARRKLSEAGRGRRKPDGFGAKVSAAQLGQSKNWSPEGRERVIAAAARGLRNFWGRMTPDEKAAVCKIRADRLLAAIPPEKRSEASTQRNHRAWAARTPEERSRIGRKIADRRAANHTAEEISKIASDSARKGHARNPDLRKASAAAVRRWWANLTPEAKADYVQRRALAIKEAKAKKKAALNERDGATAA